MKNYLICFDMDGTLLNEEKTISKKTKDYVMEISKNNKVVICSGRPIRGLLNYYNELLLDTPICSDNGAVITFNIKSKPWARVDDVIDRDVFFDFYNDIKPFNKSCYFAVGNNIYIYNRLERLEVFYHIDESSNVFEGDFTREMLKDTPYGLLFIIDSTKMAEFENIIDKKYSNYIGRRSFGNDNKNAIYEIFSKNVSKGNAISKLQEYYNIDKDHTICFGDHLNDISMFSFAKYKVAMKNGVSDMHKLSNFITEKDNDHDGIYYMLKKFNETL